MDILIPFQTSLNKDAELKYTLRTIAKHLKGAGRAFIVGDAPQWEFDRYWVVHVPCKNYYAAAHYRDRNIVCKMLAGFAHSWVASSAEVLVTHDDNFILPGGACDISEWPQYTLMDHWGGQGDYGVTELNTRSLPGFEDAWNFDLHAPHRMIPSVAAHYLSKGTPGLDWNIKHGYCIKTLYCHQTLTGSSEHAELHPDLKIRWDLNAVELQAELDKVPNRAFWSSDDLPWRLGVGAWLKENYPEKSKYER